MSIGTKMRGVGESTYYTKLLRPQLEEVLNKSDYEMEHILGKRKLVVHTDRISDELSDSISTLLEHESPKNIEVERYNHHIEVSWRDINKYAHCVTYKDLYNVNSDYGNDVTTDGEWVYPLPNLVTASDYPNSTTNPYCLFRTSTKLKKWSVDLPKATTTFYMFRGSTLEEFNGALPVVRSRYDGENKMFGTIGYTGQGLKVFKSSDFGIANGNKWFDYIQSFHTFEADLPKLTRGSLMFPSARLNKKSALRIFNSIPAYTSGDHPLTIGIHIDHQNDEEVLTAIANAEAKGWTLTVQWNGASSKDESLSSEIINKLELTTIQLPENYTRLLYLESDENSQNINTNYIPTNNTGISVIAKQITSFDGVPLGCGNMSNGRIFAPRVTLVNNNWSYGWSSFVHGGNTTTNAKGRIYEGQLNYLNSKIASVYLNDGTYKENTLTDLSFTPTSPIHLFGYYSNTNNSINSIWKGRIYRVTITENDSIVKDFIPCLDQNNVPCMYDIVNEVAYYNTKEGTSFGYEEPKEEMHNIITTYGMRGRYFQPVIYAKLSEIERPDGSKEQNLDWGHYVTNPEDYQEFSSLEEAREYFGISEEN